MSINTIDTIIWFLPLLSAPLSLLFVVLLFFAETTKQRLTYLFSIAAALTIGVGWYSSICWAFRDGLGPGSVESRGQLAWSRYMGDMRDVFVFAAFIVVSSGIALWRSIHKNRSGSTLKLGRNTHQ